MGLARPSTEGTWAALELRPRWRVGGRLNVGVKGGGGGGAAAAAAAAVCG